MASTGREYAKMRVLSRHAEGGLGEIIQNMIPEGSKFKYLRDYGRQFVEKIEKNVLKFRYGTQNCVQKSILSSI